jgi:AcrR family transcriptional regulator
MTEPPATTARSAKAAQTRTRILEAARRVLGEEGPDRFTTRRVAELAGVSHGMCHYHFQDKRELTLALIVHARRDWVEPLEELVDGPGTAEARMRAVIAWMAEPQTTDVMRVHQTLFVFALQDELVRQRLAAEFARCRAVREAVRGAGRRARPAGPRCSKRRRGVRRRRRRVVQEQSLDPSLSTATMLTST